MRELAFGRIYSSTCLIAFVELCFELGLLMPCSPNQETSVSPPDLSMLILLILSPSYKPCTVKLIIGSFLPATLAD